MPDLSKLPVTVITGFLGAGKTTLIRHLMQNPQGKRLAVVVNEFGDVGVDGYDGYHADNAKDKESNYICNDCIHKSKTIDHRS